MSSTFAKVDTSIFVWILQHLCSLENVLKTSISSTEFQSVHGDSAQIGSNSH